MTDKLDKVLGLTTLPSIIDPNNALLPPEAIGDEQIETDTDVARDGLYDALGKSQQAVSDMLMIAQQSQHPKAYEVLNATVKTLADVSMSLADLQLKKQRLNNNKGSVSDEEGNVVNNNLFVGSTADLQKMIEDMKNKK